jgi:hypothetical protein
LVSIEGESNLPTFRTPGGDSILVVTVLTAGIQKGRPGVWVTNRTNQPIPLPQGCVRLTVTPVFEIGTSHIIKTALENEESAEDLRAAGIRLPPVVTGDNLAGEGESPARSVFHSSRGNNYPNNLIPELRTVFDLIPNHKRQQAWEVIDDYYTPELSKKNQFDILDKLDIQDRHGGLDIAPWEVKPTQRSVNHLSRSPIDPKDIGPIPDITDRSEGEQRWVHKLISTVEKFVDEEER